MSLISPRSENWLKMCFRMWNRIIESRFKIFIYDLFGNVEIWWETSRKKSQWLTSCPKTWDLTVPKIFVPVPTRGPLMFSPIELRKRTFSPSLVGPPISSPKIGLSMVGLRAAWPYADPWSQFPTVPGICVPRDSKSRNLWPGTQNQIFMIKNHVKNLWSWVI